MYTFLDVTPKFILLEKKALGEESGGRILLGNNTDGEAAMLWPIRFRCVGVRVTAGLRYVYAHTYVQLYVCMDLNWTPLYIRVHLTTCVPLMSDWRKFRFAPGLPGT